MQWKPSSHILLWILDEFTEWGRGGLRLPPIYSRPEIYSSSQTSPRVHIHCRLHISIQAPTGASNSSCSRQSSFPLSCPFPPTPQKKKKPLFLIYLSLNYNQKTSHLTQGSSAISCPSFRHPYPIKLTSLTPCLLNPYMSLHSPRLLFHSRSPLFLAWNYLNLSTCFPAY